MLTLKVLAVVLRKVELYYFNLRNISRKSASRIILQVLFGIMGPKRNEILKSSLISFVLIGKLIFLYHF